MKNIKLYIPIFILIMGLVSCTDGFEDLNTDGNNANEQNITSINPLIGHVQRHIFAPDRYSSWRGNLIMGARSAEQFSFGFTGTWFPDGAGLDGGNAGWNDASWDQPIDRNLGTLNKLNDLTASGGRFEDAGANAVVKIMKSFLVQRLTDQFGDIPFSELGSANFPKYDSQAEVYNGVMNDLTDAISTLGSSSAVVESISQGDYMFAGDTEKWIAAANTLRLRMALRSSNASGNNAQANIDLSLNESFINDNSGNVQLAQDPAQTDPVGNSWYGIWNTWLNTETGGTPAGWVLAETLVEKLKSDNDPRLFAFAQPIKGGTAGDPNSYAGSKVAALSTTYISADELSLPLSPMLNDANFPIIEMTYAEAELLQAEAQLLKNNVGQAQTHFTNGINASMAQWNVDPALATDFSTSAAATLSSDVNEARNQIGVQRWIAAYTNGREAWSVMRRFKGLNIYPDKTFGNNIWASTAGTVGSDNKLPQRLVYPQSELTLNSSNVNEAIDRQGEDKMSTALWWAK